MKPKLATLFLFASPFLLASPVRATTHNVSVNNLDTHTSDSDDVFHALARKVASNPRFVVTDVSHSEIDIGVICMPVTMDGTVVAKVCETTVFATDAFSEIPTWLEFAGAIVVGATTDDIADGLYDHFNAGATDPYINEREQIIVKKVSTLTADAIKKITNKPDVKPAPKP